MTCCDGIKYEGGYKDRTLKSRGETDSETKVRPQSETKSSNGREVRDFGELISEEKSSNYRLLQMNGREVMVGATGFEPATARPPGVCATRLRYAPIPRL